jgi:hypothetical protein
MTQPLLCDYCNNTFPNSSERCPHCGKPGLYANVNSAKEPDELSAPQQRYDDAKIDAATRGAEVNLAEFENAVASSRAVFARSINEVQRLASSDNDAYATYYELLDAGVRIHTDDEWSIRRAGADEAVFPGYKKKIRFAALSLDDTGLTNYGGCSIVLRTDMIAHRASVFEENSTIFMKHHHIETWETPHLPRGYRATWDDRAKLRAAKLFSRIDATTSTGEYSTLLLREGTTTADDDFVEVHIWGSMTRRTMEQVTITERLRHGQGTIVKALKEKLREASVKVKVR